LISHLIKKIKIKIQVGLKKKKPRSRYIEIQGITFKLPGIMGIETKIRNDVRVAR
jgi:hypothetical protein